MDALSAAPAARARGAYVAWLGFVVAVYGSAAHLVPALAPLAPSQTLVALAVVALAWSCLLGGRRPRLGLAAGGAALYGFFALVLVSPLWSAWPEVSFATAAESLKCLAAFALAANVLDTPGRIRRAAAVIALASLAPAAGAIHSKLTGAHLVEGTRAAWLGVFGNPNFLAYHLVVSTPIALALGEAVPRDARRRALTRAGWLAVIVAYAVAILLTESRGGALGLGAVLILWLARDLARGRGAIGAACAVAAALLVAPAGPWDRADTRATLSGEVDASAQGRLDAWRTALRIVEHHPASGVGAGAFVLAYERYAPGDAGPPRTAHNTFLMIAAELGVPALALFVAALAGASVALSRAARRAPPRLASLARGVPIALFGFVVCSLTGGYAFTWPLYFALGVAAAIALVVKERR